MNPRLDSLLAQTEDVMHAVVHNNYRGEYHVGVDLGTAYTVLLVLDEEFKPLAGAYRFANVVRDGLVVDFIGVIDSSVRTRADCLVCGIIVGMC